MARRRPSHLVLPRVRDRRAVQLRLDRRHAPALGALALRRGGDGAARARGDFGGARDAPATGLASHAVERRRRRVLAPARRAQDAARAFVGRRHRRALRRRHGDMLLPLLELLGAVGRGAACALAAALLLPRPRPHERARAPRGRAAAGVARPSTALSRRQSAAPPPSSRGISRPIASPRPSRTPSTSSCPRCSRRRAGSVCRRREAARGTRRSERACVACRRRRALRRGAARRGARDGGDPTLALAILRELRPALVDMSDCARRRRASPAACRIPIKPQTSPRSAWRSTASRPPWRGTPPPHLPRRDDGDAAADLVHHRLLRLLGDQPPRRAARPPRRRRRRGRRRSGAARWGARCFSGPAAAPRSGRRADGVAIGGAAALGLVGRAARSWAPVTVRL